MSSWSVRPSLVLDQAPTAPASGPSLGQTFDRMIEDQACGGSSRPSRPIRGGGRPAPRPAMPGFEFRAVTTGFERAYRATRRGRRDGRRYSAACPDPRDRSRVFARRPATLPPGIARIPEQERSDADGRPDRGPPRPAVGEGRRGGLADRRRRTAHGRDGTRVVPGARDRSPATRASGYETVAFATVMVSEAPTVRWEKRVEASRSMARPPRSRRPRGRRRSSRLTEDPVMACLPGGRFDSLTAHDGRASPRTPSTGRPTSCCPAPAPAMASIRSTSDSMRPASRPDSSCDFSVVHLDWPQSCRRGRRRTRPNGCDFLLSVIERHQGAGTASPRPDRRSSRDDARPGPT